MVPGPKDSVAAEAGRERIARRIARAGLCSRRDAEKLIAAGRVAVNGETVRSPALNVSPADAVSVDGTPLPTPEIARLWRLHKEKGRITAARDPEGRPTVFDDLPKEMPRVISIGRLDFNTEGLLLLTNDGALARALELPATGWVRRYRVRVFGTVDPEALAAIAKGVTIEGMRYGPVTAALERKVGANSWLSLALTEGKNREVRNILAHLGLTVSRLIRVSYGPFQLGSLAPGTAAEVPRRQLVEQLGHLLPDARPGEAAGGTGRARAKPPPKHRPRRNGTEVGKPGRAAGPGRPSDAHRRRPT